MKIYTIINQKGGVAKTTTAHTLGHALAVEGRKVLLVDLDNQANLSLVCGAEPGRPGAFELLTGAATLKESIQATETKGLHILPGSLKMAQIDIALANIDKKAYRLKESLKGAKYDYIIIDVPPALGTAHIMALTASNFALIPTAADIFGLEALKLVNMTITEVRKKTNKKLRISGVFFTKFTEKSSLQKRICPAFETVAEKMGTRVLNSFIRESKAVTEAQAMAETVIERNAKNAAALDYLALLKELKKIEKENKK
ncbi:MAG: AAA family ATPase [Fibrobacter sp.]|nr:AAA family ATPase [Fibrobacter sp.]